MAASYSPLPYTGNKGCIANDLLAFMPPHETYMEPCAGSAEIFFRKPPSPREILNDYSNDITNLYRTLQNNRRLGSLLGRLCLSIGAEQLFKYNKELLMSTPNVLDDLRETDDVVTMARQEDLDDATDLCIEQAAAFFENQVYSFSSTGQTYGIEARNIAKRIDRLLAATARLRDAAILHRDYKDAMLYAASESTFYLLDPPYRGTEDCYPKGNFDGEQHNHGIDSRYTGPHSVAPTMSARYGTGGNNTPLVGQTEEPVYCIVGNAIDRKPENGGNGLGYQKDLAYTLTAFDHHAVFARQRTDAFRENDVASTESARQHKDATDLVLQQTVGALTSSDRKGPNNQYVSQDKCVVEGPHLIRRLTPTECERLQGFPDGWTDLPGASDAARYKALGNSVAIPCVEVIMEGIARAARNSDKVWPLYPQSPPSFRWYS